MSNLESQLANIFKKGLAADPKAAKSLAAALSSHTDGEGVTKAEANYHTSQDSNCCGNCEHFDGVDKCDVVSGHVTADGVSDYWAEGGSSKPSDSKDQQDNAE